MGIESFLILVGGGLCSGLLAGFLGVGGGIIIVPLLVSLGYVPAKAVATSSLTVAIIAISGSLQNRRMGYLNSQRVFWLGIPALLTAQVGAYLAGHIASYLLLFTFGVFLVANIYLVDLRRRLSSQTEACESKKLNPWLAIISTGGIGGLLAGLLGGGGGAIMVPLQMLFLGESIKTAIQTSLGVIVYIAISACIIHALESNILFGQGIILGVGGYLGAQASTRILPKLPDSAVSIIFRVFLSVLALYMFHQAWVSYQGSLSR
jgi:uncharacterized membrane protein YfcA